MLYWGLEAIGLMSGYGDNEVFADPNQLGLEGSEAFTRSIVYALC